MMTPNANVDFLAVAKQIRGGSSRFSLDQSHDPCYLVRVDRGADVRDSYLISIGSLHSVSIKHHILWSLNGEQEEFFSLFFSLLWN